MGIVWFLLGLIVGGNLGVMLMAMFKINKDK